MKKEYIYAGVSIFLWSTTATVTKLLLGSLNSMQITLISSLLSTVFLLAVNIAKGTIRELKGFKLKDFAYTFLLGTIGIFIYHLCLYIGIDRMEASQAFIINYLWPIMTVVFACIILKEKMTVRKAIAILLSFIGVVVVTSNGSLLSISANTLSGAVYCIIAAVAYGLFSILNKQKPYNKYLSMLLYYVASFIVSLVWVLVTRDGFTIEPSQTVGILWSGIFTTAVAYTSWALALEYGDTAKISNLAYITPFLSLVWTTLVLKEAFKPWSLIGLAIIVIGIFIQMKDKRNT
ncbi:MAG: DMT family transporter [Clostridia bacterium]|nr:DMT family transporter [Clostridia bacterium]